MKVSSYLSEGEKLKRSERRRLVGICGVGIGGLVLIGAAWMVRYAPLFNVKNVIVEGNQRLKAEEVLAVAQGIALQSSVGKLLGIERLFAWPENKYANLALLPAVAELSISKSFRAQEVKLQVKEREAIGIWCVMSSLTSCWWFDKEGILFARALDGEGGLLKTVHDYSGRPLGIGNPVLDAKVMENLLEIFTALRASGATLQEVKLGDVANEEVEVITHKGPRFYFSLRFPLREAVQVVRDIFSNSGKFPPLGKIEYVDMRVENRVYYK
ncbi:MAG: hypothetical protein FJY98_04070 [Candidatus Liptonbacteria bacterium]|nr:hypothetical protein [Candidatus Liptonbacteria bacterium]